MFFSDDCLRGKVTWNNSLFDSREIAILYLKTQLHRTLKPEGGKHYWWQRWNYPLNTGKYHLNAREDGKCNPPVAQEEEEMTLVSSWQSPPHLLTSLLQPVFTHYLGFPKLQPSQTDLCSPYWPWIDMSKFGQ